MSKGLKILFAVLIIVIGALATSSGLFYAKILNLQKSENTKDTTAVTADTTKKVTDDSTKTTTTTSTTAAPLGNRPSSPSDTVKIAEGQTLFEVGQEVGVSWTVLAEVNGIDADKIQAGQTIIVPKNNEVCYTINQDKAKTLQADVDSGKYAFRLSPVETAKSDSPTVYGLADTDIFTQKLLDEAGGTATVLASHGDKTYLISLVQPATKGAKGIWAIESIKPSEG